MKEAGIGVYNYAICDRGQATIVTKNVRSKRVTRVID